MNAWGRHRNFAQSIVLLLVFWTATRAHAISLPNLAFDSLIYAAPEIVEGTLGEAHTNNRVSVRSFLISQVDGGNLKAGQVISVVIVGYDVLKPGPLDWRALEKGDQLVLFLEPGPDGHFKSYYAPTNEVIYQPVDSGIRILQGEKAFAFKQLMNPGPYGAIPFAEPTNDVVWYDRDLTNFTWLPELRRQISGGIQRMVKWRPMLDRKATTNDVPDLLEILRDLDHSSNHQFPELNDGSMLYALDPLFQKAADHLDELHDLPAVTNVVVMDPSLIWNFESTFATPAGWNFTMSRIQDKSLPVDQRIYWARSIRWPSGDFKPRDLTPIARLAVRKDVSPKTRDWLLEHLRYLGTSAFEKQPGTPKNLGSAGRLLESYYQNRALEPEKYSIETVFAAWDGSHPRTTLPAVISVLTHDMGSEYYRRHTPAGQLSFDYKVYWVRQCHLLVRTALVNVRTAKEWTAAAHPVLPSSTQRHTAGEDQITLTAGLPHGRYCVFYEYLEDGKVTATSHFFVTGL